MKNLVQDTVSPQFEFILSSICTSGVQYICLHCLRSYQYFTCHFCALCPPCPLPQPAYAYKLISVFWWGPFSSFGPSPSPSLVLPLFRYVFPFIWTVAETSQLVSPPSNPYSHILQALSIIFRMKSKHRAGLSTIHAAFGFSCTLLPD